MPITQRQRLIRHTKRIKNKEFTPTIANNKINYNSPLSANTQTIRHKVQTLKQKYPVKLKPSVWNKTNCVQQPKTEPTENP
jgi:hypothetical protein